MAELQARCPDSRFDAYGVGGQQTSHMRWRFRQDVFGVGTTAAKPSYTHVIVFGGINDLAARHITPRALAEIEGNLAKMYGMAAARGLEVIAVALPPWGQSKFGKRPKAKATAVLNEWLSARAQTGQVDALVDVGADLACGSAMNLCPKYRKFPSDHVHWNAAGHRVLARHLFSQVFSDCR